MQRPMDYMIDLETLGTGSRAVILQIGAVRFDRRNREAPVPILNVNVDIDSCLAAGGEVNGDTIMWWLRQSAEARGSVAAQSLPRYLIGAALVLLTQALEEGEDCHVWCHGATFDAPILQHYYAKLGVAAPWKFWNVRDTRTLFEAAEQLTGWERPKRPTAHVAVIDATVQALDVQEAWAELRGHAALA